MLLAIDTSTAVTGLACYDESGLLAECCWLSGREQTVQLLPQLDMLLRHVGRAPSDVRAVGVALGPGSWSGLRVGMSIAKGFVIACDLPLIGVGTLDMLAYQHYQIDTPVCPIIRLGRERFATALFVAPPVAPFAASARSVTLPELAEGVAKRTLFCGDIDDQVKNELTRQLGDTAVFPTPAANGRRAGFLAELAWQRWQHGSSDDRATLEPIYLGNPVKHIPAP